MATVALFLLGAASLVLALHSFVTYPLSLLAVKAWQRRRLPAPKWSRPLAAHRIAICTVVGDSVGLSETKLRNLLALHAGRPLLHLMVYVDGEAPEVLALLKPHRAQVDICVSAVRRGRSHGMNMLASRTRADLLVFADAAVLLDEQLPAQLDRHFADRTVGCVCAVRVQRRLDAWIEALEADTGSTAGADASLLAVRAALYHPSPVEVPHELYVSLMVLCSGHRVVCAGELRAEASVPSVRTPVRRAWRESLRQSLRLHRFIAPMLWRLDALSVYKYVSRKLLRRLSGYLLTAACGFFAVAASLSH